MERSALPTTFRHRTERLPAAACIRPVKLLAAPWHTCTVLGVAARVRTYALNKLAVLSLQPAIVGQIVDWHTSCPCMCAFAHAHTLAFTHTRLCPLSHSHSHSHSHPHPQVGFAVSPQDSCHGSPSCNIQFIATVGLGTPKQAVRLILDTGSSLLAVSCAFSQMQTLLRNSTIAPAVTIRAHHRRMRAGIQKRAGGE